MVKRFGYVALVGLAALWPVAVASAERDHHDHDDHHDRHDGHGSGFGIHFGGGGVGIHYEDGDHGHHDDHWERDHHSGRHHSDWHHSDRHHSGWHLVVPHYDRHYHGTYYHDGGINYYVPRTYVTDSRSYVAAKPVEIEFGGYAHVDDLAGRLERQANQLCLELHYNYRHNRGFAETYREAYQVLEAAKYIHAKENQGDRDEVARRLDAIDGLFHHVRDDVRTWSRRQRKQVGQGGAQTKLDSLEATLHHLMYDVGVKGSHAAPGDPAAPIQEAAPPPVN